MSEKLNTHYYDGSLKDRYKKLVEIQNTTTDFFQHKWDINIVIKEIYENMDKLPNFSIKKRETLIQILKLFYTDRRGNYDPLNDIDVLDILCRTWYFVRKQPIEDQIPFYEQLVEINNGKCAQGRSTRIFQIFTTYFSDN